MKKTIVYILTVMTLVLALGGCGDGRVDDEIRVTPIPQSTRMPQATQMPQVSAMPEFDDGIVNDDNGVITEGDNGPLETKTPAPEKPKNTVAPKASESPAP